MTTLQLFIVCITIISSTAIISYTAWAILTNERLVKYTHDYLTSRKSNWRDAA